VARWHTSNYFFLLSDTITNKVPGHQQCDHNSQQLHRPYSASSVATFVTIHDYRHSM